MVFKKGEINNPIGRPAIPQEIKFIKKLNRDFVELKITELLKKSIYDLEEILRDKNNQSIDHFIAKIIYIGIQRGDPIRLNLLFDRVIGRVKDMKEIKLVKPFRVESLSGDKIIDMGVEDIKEE